MFTSLLFIHSWLRWIVLILAIVVVFKSMVGWFAKRQFTRGDNQTAVFFIAFMHTQLVLGLILYFVYSPLGYAAFDEGMGAVMKNGALRYWAVEHITTMILAVVLAQVGRSISKKAATAVKKHRSLAIFTFLALILMLSRIPWDQAGRMFRGLG